MKTETIDLENGRLEVFSDGNLIYLNMFGEYTDNDGTKMTKYLESFFSEMGEPTIRVWDTTNLSKGGFKLTTKGIDKFAEWSQRIKEIWPDNVTYLISDNPLKFGVARMYELKASENDESITVVHTIDELPENIKKFILQNREKPIRAHSET